MRKSGQAAMFRRWETGEGAFGGSLLKNSHAKCKRPFRKKLALHIVLRSSQATGSKSLLKHSERVDEIVTGEAKRSFLKLHSAANAGNHLHLLVQAPSDRHLGKFLRAVSLRISMLVTGARRGTPHEGPKFWDQRPFSRLVTLGSEFQNVCRYIAINSTEMAGFTRSAVRQMFREIRDALARGQIPRSPDLYAAGFT